MYQQLDVAVPLSQGDIIDECPIFAQDITNPPVDLALEPTRWSARVVVLTQACDLAQAKTTRVVVAQVHAAQALVDAGLLKAPAIRDQIRRHLMYGWYFLPTAPAPLALPESIVDLRDLHTVPRLVLEQLISDGKRVCGIATPYREHLAQHLATTYARIALPEPYETQP